MTSNSFKQHAYAQETDQACIALITISSDELEENLYVSSDPTQILPTANVYGTISNGQEYVFLPFDLYLPADDKTGAVTAKLIIENIDRRIIEIVRTVSKPVNMNIKMVLSGDLDFIEIEYDNFKLTNITYDSMTVTGDISLEYWGLEPFPSKKFTPSNFPGLF